VSRRWPLIRGALCLFFAGAIVWPQLSTAAADSPPAQPKETKPLDIETLAKNPAWWPKEVSLTQALAVPLFANGQASGQAQLPAHTLVHLVRINGQQLEIEFLNQHVTAAYTATDVLARAAEIQRRAEAISAIPPPLQVGHYRSEAHQVMEDLQTKYWMPQSQRYAKKPGSKDPDFAWGSGVAFTALVGAARNEPDHYKQYLGKFFEGLNGYWDGKQPLGGYEPSPTSGNGHDKYYDDNAWLAITFFEAYELTRTQQYHRRAEETLDFVLSGWDDVLGGGIWWHELHEKKTPGKNTCANAPSAVACLLSAKLNPDPRAAAAKVDWARKIVQWTNQKLQLENGLFADSVAIDGGMNRGQLTYNSALMQRADVGLYRATREAHYLIDAQRIGKAAEGFMDQEKGAFRDPIKWAHLQVEADLELYRATHEEYLLTRARKNADYYWGLWKDHPPEDLISMASIARTLWLMADMESDSGRRFWELADSGGLR
jgi:hypothetical protein